MNLYIKVEVSKRDLESRFFLGLVAAERGHDVWIGPAGLTTRLAVNRHIQPGIIHEKSITPGHHRLEQLESYRSGGYLCTSQDEESGILEEDYGEFAEMRFSKKSLDLTDKVFAWGDHDKSSLVERYQNVEGIDEKVADTGSPRVDLWRPECDGLYPKPTGAVAEKKYVLMVSNFGAIAGYDAFWQEVEYARRTGYAERGYDVANQIDRNAFRMELMGKFVAALKRLAVENPETVFVFRPHPIENPRAWRAFIGNVPNVVIDNSGPISRWVRHANLIIHNGCTTALEAVISRKPVIAFRPLISRHEEPFPNAASHEVFSQDDLSRVVKALLKDNELSGVTGPEGNLLVVSRRLASLEGRFAAEKIVEEWEKLTKYQAFKANLPLKLRCLAWIYFWRRRASAVFSLNALMKGTAREVQRFKFPPLKRSEIDALQARFVDTLDRFSTVRVRLYGRYLIHMSSR